MFRRSTYTPVTLTDVELAMLKPGTPIAIHWVDARHVASSWIPLSVAAGSETCHVRSVGVFLAATDEEVFYAADYASFGPDTEPHVNAVSAIPRGCIREIHQLGDTDG